MHHAAERGNLEEMHKAAAHDPSSVASKGHMGVSINICACVCLGGVEPPMINWITIVCDTLLRPAGHAVPVG